VFFILFLILAGAIFAQEVSVEDALRMAAQGRLPEAETALRALAAKNPRDGDLRYRLGLVLLKQKKIGEAAQALEEAAQIEPDFVFAWLALGDVRLRQENRAGAAVAAKRARVLAGKSATAWKGLEALEIRLGDALGQAQALEMLVRLTPEDRDVYVRLASLLLEHRTAAAAKVVAEAGLRRFPRDAGLLRLQGLAWYGLGRKQEALSSFLAAMDAAPADEEAHASVETLLGDAGDQLPQVIERLRRFSAQRPESPLGPFLLALASASPTEKMDLLGQAIGADSNFWPAWFELHRLLREQGGLQPAIEALETTLRLNPNHEGAHFALAELYLELGDREKARQHRIEHHRLRAAAAAEEQKRAAEAPKFTVNLQ
jgi:tetratricopeptide (TPR) repeat protein